MAVFNIVTQKIHNIMVQIYNQTSIHIIMYLIKIICDLNY